MQIPGFLLSADSEIIFLSRFSVISHTHVGCFERERQSEAKGTPPPLLICTSFLKFTQNDPSRTLIVRALLARAPMGVSAALRDRQTEQPQPASTTNPSNDLRPQQCQRTGYCWRCHALAVFVIPEHRQVFSVACRTWSLSLTSGRAPALVVIFLWVHPPVSCRVCHAPATTTHY